MEGLLPALHIEVLQLPRYHNESTFHDIISFTLFCLLRAIPFQYQMPIIRQYTFQSNPDQTIDALFNNDITEGNWRPSSVGLDPYRPHTIWIQFPPQWAAVPRKIRLHWPSSPTYISLPTKFFVRKAGTETWIQIGKFEGSHSAGWFEFNVSDSTTAAECDMIRIEGGREWDLLGPANGGGELYGNEIEVIGDWLESPWVKYLSTPGTWGMMYGSNGFQWDWTLDDAIGFGASGEVPAKTNRYSEMGLQAYRFYMKWNDLELGQDTFSLGWTVQGWPNDSLFDICKRRGVEPILNIIGMPYYMYSTWPDGDSVVIHKNAHGYSVGMVLYRWYDFSINDWVYERSNATQPADHFPYNYQLDDPWRVDGVVIRVIDANNFVVGEAGHTFNTGNPLGLSINSTYYLSPSTGVGVNYTTTLPPPGNMKEAIFKTDASGEATILLSTNPLVGHPFEMGTPYTFQNRGNGEDPFVYARSARLGFVVAARWGSNASVPDALMGKYFDHAEPWIHDDYIRKGLNTVHIYEIANERDANWIPPGTPWQNGGQDHFMNGYKHAAYLSAVYDGHKGTMGPGYGIKNADPNAIVVIPGFALFSSQALLGIYEWSRKYRGYKLDGSVDLPFDVENSHHYSINQNNQYANMSTAMPPEYSSVMPVAQDFMDFSQTYGRGRPVWLTEWGFDYNTGSRYQFPAFSSYTSQQAIGIMSIRTMLKYFQKGYNRTTWFKTFDNNPDNPTQFWTMSLMRIDTGVYQHPLRPIGYYMSNAKIFKDYVFDSTLRNDTLQIMKLRKPGTGKIAYVAYRLEDTTGFFGPKFDPFTYSFQIMRLVAFTERTGTWNIPLASNPEIKVHRLQDGSLNFNTQTIQVTGGSYGVGYNSSPVFIELTENTTGNLPIPPDRRKIPGALKRKIN
jgi:hypothetical protein